MLKETRKALKTVHDNIDSHVKKSGKADQGLLDIIPEGMRVGVYESDFTEKLDSGRSDIFEKSGEQKLRADIIEARLSADGISEHKKYSNTTKKLKYYMTKYYKTGCNPGFAGYIRLSQEVNCPSDEDPFANINGWYPRGFGV